MHHGLLPQAATLRKLSVHGAGGDGLRARLRTEAVLNGVDWALPGLPPQAVLLVRRMVLAPSPLLALGPQLAAMLQGCASAARRPWLQADAAAAEAVLFADDAELATCLVSDVLRGQVSGRWWWRAVLAGREVQAWLCGEVLARGTLLAPVLALLSERGQALAWAASWRDADAQAGLAALAHAHAWVLPGGAGGDAAWPDSVATASPARASMDAAGDAANLARLQACLPELRQVEALRAPAARLLAAALLLSRASSWLKAAPGTAAWATWAAGLREPRPQVVAPKAKPTALVAPTRPLSVPGPVTAPDHLQEVLEPPQRPLRQVQFVEPHVHTPPEQAPARPKEPVSKRRSTAIRLEPLEGANAVSTTQDAGSVVMGNAQRPASIPDAHDQHDWQPSGAQQLPVPRVAGGQGEGRASPGAEAARPSVPAVDPTSAVADALPQQWPKPVTRYAGLFYLLNLALALDLYGDFTMPRARGLALSPWDLLAMAGRRWFGAEFENDPLWRVLADLAGRDPAQPPGADFVPPCPNGVTGDWQIDPDWLVPWGPNPVLRWRRTAQRSLARHPAGFVVSDLSRHGAPARRDQGAARWMRHLLGYVCARVALALGCERPAEVPALLCCHAGSVHVSSTAVNVVLSLEALPVSIRLAGLDRDPGWIPACGRSIALHFE